MFNKIFRVFCMKYNLITLKEGNFIFFIKYIDEYMYLVLFVEKVLI